LDEDMDQLFRTKGAGLYGPIGDGQYTAGRTGKKSWAGGADNEVSFKDQLLLGGALLVN